MKIKLKKFTELSKSILPHEAQYLALISNFQDPEKQQIFNQVVKNSVSESIFISFDDNIDKRKFNYIKNWMEKKLTFIDVDLITEWIMLYKKKILTDTISSLEEVHFLQYIQGYKQPDYNFQNLYELAREYRAYLLIRMRYKDHQIIANFLELFSSHFTKAKKIQDKLYQATTEITNQYTLKNNETKYWEKWLFKVFSTTTIDGRNRYQAFVLLAFMFTNYNDNQKLKQLFDQIDVFFSRGEMYSRRLLSNYYANRVLLHSKENELTKAEYFGFLSIRQNNDDTLMYVNNLVAILIKNNKPQKALELLENFRALSELTHNYHQKISYTSYHIRLLTDFNQLLQAENIARHFLRKNEEAILKHRWHLFFTSYFNVLITKEKYEEVLQLFQKYKLQERENDRRKSSNYVPTIAWSVSLSKYMEGKINSVRLLQEIKEPLEGIIISEKERNLMIQVIDRLSKNLPEAFSKLKSHLKLST
ncbi:hypothetical protein [Flavobacterium sp. W20_MBD1_R3]|uniref:hypothetical protein n=1 Tax=Flavobacterium sp. W20_MBD1_R3 TaxID=3240278 RepID=UPI003F906D40